MARRKKTRKRIKRNQGREVHLKLVIAAAAKVQAQVTQMKNTLRRGIRNTNIRSIAAK